MSRVTDMICCSAIFRGRLSNPPGCMEHGFPMTCERSFRIKIRIRRASSVWWWSGVVNRRVITEIEMSQNPRIRLPVGSMGLIITLKRLRRLQGPRGPGPSKFHVWDRESGHNSFTQLCRRRRNIIICLHGQNLPVLLSE